MKEVISHCYGDRQKEKVWSKMQTEAYGKCPEGSGTGRLGCSRWQCSDDHHSWWGVGGHVCVRGHSDRAIRSPALEGHMGRRPGSSGGKEKDGTLEARGRKVSGTGRWWAESPGEIGARCCALASHRRPWEAGAGGQEPDRGGLGGRKQNLETLSFRVLG